MYGTVARTTLKPGAEQRMMALMRAEEEARIPGDRGTPVYRSDRDPNEYFLAIRFASKEAYRANAASPGMHRRYRQDRELREADPEWHDGEIVSSGVGGPGPRPPGREPRRPAPIAPPRVRGPDAPGRREARRRSSRRRSSPTAGRRTGGVGDPRRPGADRQGAGWASTPKRCPSWSASRRWTAPSFSATRAEAAFPASIRLISSASPRARKTTSRAARAASGTTPRSPSCWG